MKTFLLFYLDKNLRELQLKEIKKVYKNLSLNSSCLLAIEQCYDTEQALSDCKVILGKLYSRDPSQVLRVLFLRNDSLLSESELLQLGNIMSDYNCLLCLNHSSFAQLPDPNVFDYRFLGIFSDGEEMKETPLFEFILTGDDKNGILKNESKSFFEDSVFNFYGNRISQSVAGFQNVLKIFPSDKASMRYIERGKTLLSDKRGL